MKMKCLIIYAFLLTVFGTINISVATSYTYNPNAGWSYLCNMCGSINNFAAFDGTCTDNDSGSVLCGYTYCDPYKFYPNRNMGGSDCANFLSQCLIAGGLNLPGNDCPAAESGYIGGGDSGTTMPSSIDIDNFLATQEGGLVTEWKALTLSSTIPVDITAGDVMIYFNKDYTKWHSTMIQTISGNGSSLNPVLGYHGGSGSTINGGGCVCYAAGSYKALYKEYGTGGDYDSCDWFHFGPVSQEDPCVGCQPPATAPYPPSSLIANQVSNGIKLIWPKTNFDHSTGFYRIYRRPTSSPDISYSTCIVSLSMLNIPSAAPNDPHSPYYDWLQYTDTLSCFKSALPGIQYSYSIAAANMTAEGCNGPFAQGCNWQTQGCGVCVVNEATATMPSTMTVQNALIPRSPTDITIHGSPIIILPNTTVYSEGGKVNFVSP